MLGWKELTFQLRRHSRRLAPWQAATWPGPRPPSPSPSSHHAGPRVPTAPGPAPWMNEMKACDHLPTHLGRGALHTRRPPPRQVSVEAPSRRYPAKQEKVSASPTPKRKPILRLKAGTPGSSHGSRSYSAWGEQAWESGRCSGSVQTATGRPRGAVTGAHRCLPDPRARGRVLFLLPGALTQAASA